MHIILQYSDISPGDSYIRVLDLQSNQRLDMVGLFYLGTPGMFLYEKIFKLQLMIVSFDFGTFIIHLLLFNNERYILNVWQCWGCYSIFSILLMSI